MKSRFTALEEFYTAVDTLTKRLALEKCNDEAARLDFLLHKVAWTTGSELLEELALALREMNGPYSPALDREINECLAFAIHHRQILNLE